jgi:hypothetical protein
VEGNEGEFKLRGRAVELTDEQYYQAIRERWEASSSTRLHVFSVDIESASFIAYDIGGSEMIVKHWSPQRQLPGYSISFSIGTDLVANMIDEPM